MSKEIELFFEEGTLGLLDVPEAVAASLPGVQWDKRSSCHRAPGHCYREIVLALRKAQIAYRDQARAFVPTDFPFKQTIAPRSYQEEAIRAWREAGGRGVVVLPTGAGKTLLAVMLIAQTRRPALVHVPTIDLLHQWAGVLEQYLDTKVGIVGGGHNEIQPITVTTYDSAALQVAAKGNLFGLAVYDECHRLPGNQYRFAAIASLAPFRLGLTATPERPDGLESRLFALCGPVCYQANVHALTGYTLAPYDVETVDVDMKEEERLAYEEASDIYAAFLKAEKISLGGPRGWQNFIWRCSRSPEGRRAFKAYLTQKRLSQASSAKVDLVWLLLAKHKGDRILIFTQDNEMAYTIGRRFFLPVLTHQTRPKEREAYLQHFRDGSYRILVTSKVLNEGVDVPDANVAIVVSGSGSVREHVQRLGRILRARPGKRAILYELVSKSTREHFVNERRRRHHAYQESGSLSGE